MKVLVYKIKDRLSPRGGPLAVCYYLYNEMLRRGENTMEFLESDKTYETVHSVGRSITSHLPDWFNKLHRKIRGAKELKAQLEGAPAKTGVDLSAYDIIYFHEAMDMYLAREDLKDYKGTVLFQSHSPLPSWMEKCSDYPEYYFKTIKDLEKKFENVDKYAFSRADYLVYPCAEAEEAYIEAWPAYKEIMKEKEGRYLYMQTGINGVSAKRSRKEVREELKVPEDAFLMSYAGRHNTVKGYDLLKEIGTAMLKNAPNNYMGCCCNPGPIKEPSLANWTEIGWTTDPYSYVAASDVFILPNRVTYFDIVMLEVLSLGQIVVASRTGGNKFFEKNGAEGVFLYDDPKDAARVLNIIRSMTPEERRVLGAKNREFFEKRLTVETMYDGYLSMIAQVGQQING